MELRSIFESKENTQFCVVTIPTAMSVLETERLAGSLDQMKIAVRHIVVNQTWPDHAAQTYTERRKQEQTACLEQLSEARSSTGQALDVSTVPYLDTEVRGVYGLRAVSTILFGAITHT